MQKLKAAIDGKFPIKDKGPISFFLNMHLVRNRPERTIFIHQATKINKLLADFEMSGCVPAKLPADPELLLSKDMCPSSDDDIAHMSRYPYKALVGRLLYLAITCRPDLSPAVSALGRFSANPGTVHSE